MDVLKVDENEDDAETINTTVGSLSLTIGNDTCTYDIGAKVQAFFELYDSNEDDLVYLDELLLQVDALTYPSNMCSAD